MAAATRRRVQPGWSRGWESNPQPSVYKTDALPLSYLGASRVYRLRPLRARRPVLDVLRATKGVERLLDGDQDRRLKVRNGAAAADGDGHSRHRDVVRCFPQGHAVTL